MKTLKPDLKYYTFITCEEKNIERSFHNTVKSTNSMNFSNNQEIDCLKKFKEYNKRFKNHLENTINNKIKYVSFFNNRYFYSNDSCDNPPCWTCAEIRVFLKDSVKLSNKEELELQEAIKDTLKSFNYHIRTKNPSKEEFTFGTADYLVLYDDFDINFMINN